MLKNFLHPRIFSQPLVVRRNTITSGIEPPLCSPPRRGRYKRGDSFRLFWLRLCRARSCCGGGFYFVFSEVFWIPVFTGMTDTDSGLCKRSSDFQDGT